MEIERYSCKYKDTDRDCMYIAEHNGDYVLYSDHLKALAQANERAEKAEEVLGFRVSVYHAFRHSYASQLADMNVPIETIQKCLGHKDRRSTERYSRRQRASERRIINEARGKIIEFKKKVEGE